MTESDNTYTSLSEIRERKQQLKGKISAQEESMRRIWTRLFHNGTASAVKTPSRRFTGMLTTGATVFDGLLLGWKIYRRFKR